MVAAAPAEVSPDALSHGHAPFLTSPAPAGAGGISVSHSGNDNSSLVSDSQLFLSLCHRPWSLQDRLHDSHPLGGLHSQMKLGAWCNELSLESNAPLRDYLLRGISRGFDIVDVDATVLPYNCANYKSVLVGPAHTFIDDLISKELREGKYVTSECEPHCVHALGAVSKSTGGFRPITDCKRPLGISINNHMNLTHQPFKYKSFHKFILQIFLLKTKYQIQPSRHFNTCVLRMTILCL